MLRCPKCSRVYHDGTQRFCTNDGGRLQVDDTVSAPDQTLVETSSRRTPPGELIAEKTLTGALKMNSIIPEQSSALVESNSDAALAHSETFNALSTSSPLPADAVVAALSETDKVEHQAIQLAQVKNDENKRQTSDKLVRASDSLAFERRSWLNSEQSFEPVPKQFNIPPFAIGVLSALVLLSGLIFAGTYLFRERPLTELAKEQPAETLNVETRNNAPIVNTNLNLPANYSAFQNSKNNLNGVLAEKFVQFSLGYPSNWLVNQNKGTTDAANYLDVKNLRRDGLLIEQLLVSWYDSRGTFAQDNVAFPLLAEKISEKYANTKTGIPAYQQVSSGATVINGRNAYELKFTGSAVDAKDKPYKIWGRTIFLPTEQEGATSGLTLTMLATSLAPTLESVEDVGNKGELATILKTLRIE